MEVADLHANFGAVVSDVKLRDLDADTLTHIRHLLAEKGLLLFRDQSLDDDDLITVGRVIGNGRLEPSARRISHGRTNKEVVYLSNLRYEDGTYMGFPGNDTDFWHSDQEFREHPAVLACIYCVLPSPIGGQTSFASTAIDRLHVAAADVATVRDKWSTRIPAVTHDNVPKVEVAHPAVLANPRTGREYLYVSDNLVRYIGLDDHVSRRLKNDFMTAILQSRNIYSHEWRPGDYLLYDNSQVIHRREAFEGPRLLKATKIYADADLYAVPDGYIVKQLEFAEGVNGYSTIEGNR